MAQQPTIDLRDIISKCHGGFLAVGAFSFGINLLMLTAPLYMMQVFDRVLSSQSVDTLVWLTVVAGVAFLVLAALDVVRSRILVRISTWVEARLSGELLAGSVLQAAGGGGSTATQRLRDLAQVRGFFTGPGAFSLLDAPWVPVFIGFIFLLHPWLGVLALAGALLLFALALIGELLSRRPLAKANAEATRLLEQAGSAERSAGAVIAMGMLPHLLGRGRAGNTAVLRDQAMASDQAGTITATTKFCRLSLQIAVMGVGAYLVIGHEMSAGAMIAASIMLGRALAPVEQAIGSWRNLILARLAFRRLKTAFKDIAEAGTKVRLPRPQGHLKAETLSVVLPDPQRFVFKNISFELRAGEVLGIVGPSAAGKSTLARMIVGLVRPSAGNMRIDGTDAWLWHSESLGPHVGYLPQNVELFSGTIRDNIARMSDAPIEKVIEAARLAEVHDLIAGLPASYETEIGDGGGILSGGQRQRVALARAIFDDPSLLVLDEPNANLDPDGEQALLRTIAAMKAKGTTIVIIAHRASILRHADDLLMMRDGRGHLLGELPTATATRILGPAYDYLDHIFREPSAVAAPAVPVRRAAESA